MSRAPWLRLLLVASVAGPEGGPLRASDERAVVPAAQKDGEGRGPVQIVAKKSPEEIEGNGAALRKVLLTKTKVDANAVPLEEFLNKLASEHRLPLVIDKGAFADEGVQLDHPVTLQLADVALRSALTLILDPLNMTWAIEDEMLKVTSLANAAERLETRVYDVRKLVSRGELTDLMEIITACVQPDSWEEADGPASIGECRNAQAIVLRASAAVHEETRALLHELERTVKLPPGTKVPPAEPDPIRDAERALRNALRAKCSLSITEQPLDRVLIELAKNHKLPLWIDRVALSDEGISLEQEVTVDVRDLRLDSALRFLLDRTGTTWIVENEVLKVIPSPMAAERLVTRVYDVGDLLPAKELRWPPAPAVVRPRKRDATGGTGGGFGGGMGGGGMFSTPLVDSRKGIGVSPQTSNLTTRLSPPVIAQKERFDFSELIERITSEPGVAQVREFRTYIGLHLRGDASPRGRVIPRKEGAEFAELIDLILSTVEPDSWDEVGRPGSLRKLAPNVIVVRQTRAIHEQIDALLRRLRRLAETKLEPAVKNVPEDPNALTVFVYHFTGEYAYSTASLAELIPEVVARETWKPAGGEGALFIQPSSLVIRQTPAVHKEIVKLLHEVVVQPK